MISIPESGMTFGPYPDDHCFYVEKSTIYDSLQEGLKIAEFILLKLSDQKPPTLWIVEAKSSTPRPETQPNFDDFILEIRDKLVNAFSLIWASCLQRHPEADISENFRQLDLGQTQVRFILVINGHQDDWLIPIKDALNRALLPTVKTWSFAPTPVAVLNDTLAREFGLIIDPEGGNA